MSNIAYDLTKIKAFIFDIDGVLSCSTVSLSDTGQPIRTMNVKDGYALQYAAKKGYILAIISGGAQDATTIRFSKLGFRYIYNRSAIKLKDYEKFLASTGLTDEEVIFVGDDIPDYHVMKRVGLAVAPADASEEIKAIAGYISTKKGGEGAARDIIEQTLKAQKHWMNDEAFHW